jgi:hypothetical protein
MAHMLPGDFPDGSGFPDGCHSNGVPLTRDATSQATASLLDSSAR